MKVIGNYLYTLKMVLKSNQRKTSLFSRKERKKNWCQSIIIWAMNNIPFEQTKQNVTKLKKHLHNLVVLFAKK